MHFSADGWESVRNVVVVSWSEAADLQRTLTETFRRHTLTGRPAIVDLDLACLGRAVGKQRFLGFLRDQFRLSTVDEAEQFVDDLLGRSMLVQPNREQLKLVWLGRKGRVMWATFDEPNPRQNPFVSLPSDADSIRARLGLDPNEKDDLLLFVYGLPGGADARFPTIADAYAGEPWLRYFRPAGATDPCGRTMTWDTCADPPLPEVVHEAVTGETLAEPVGVAKWRRQR